MNDNTIKKYEEQIKKLQQEFQDILDNKNVKKDNNINFDLQNFKDTLEKFQKIAENK